MIHIEGYAVVSEDDCIADANGDMPDVLKTDAEWRFFQAGLDAVDVVVLGRRSHEVTPNPKGRRRLVMTGSVTGAERVTPEAVCWNPDGASLEAALGLFDEDCRRLAVTGGQGVFDYFLGGEAPYTVFHLSRIRGAMLVGGRKVFSDRVAGERSAALVLDAAGYEPGAPSQLDDLASAVSWTRKI